LKIEKDNSVQAVKRALKIIELLGRSREEWGVTDIGRELGLHKSTIYRLLSTMSEEGFIEQNASGKYQLGTKMLEIGGRMLNNIEIRKVAMPFLLELSKYVGETVHLVVLHDGEGIYVDKVEAENVIRMHSTIGARVKLHCSGVGKSILAHLPPQEVQEIIRKHGLTKITDNTIITYEALMADLANVRKLGYALDNEENEYGIRCVAGPILDYRQRPVAALSVSGPTMRMTLEKVEEIGAQVVKTALLISKRMGYIADKF
jgi:DNA-binding IclR family transcriptional regulator